MRCKVVTYQLEGGSQFDRVRICPTCERTGDHGYRLGQVQRGLHVDRCDGPKHGKPEARVRTRTVGQAFGCVGIVDIPGTRGAYMTREFPFGFEGAALEAAEQWATEQGRRVVR